MAAFQSIYNKQTEVIILRLDGAFAEKDWGDLVAFYRQKSEGGFKKWLLDFSAVPSISCNSIGVLVALNTSVMANVGAMEVVLAKNSQAANQIRFAKIDQILNCRVA